MLHHLILLSSRAVLLSYLHIGLNEDRKVPQEMLRPVEGITASNKELTVEVECLRQRLEAINHEKTVQESQNQNLVVQLSNKERETTSK